MNPASPDDLFKIQASSEDCSVCLLSPDVSEIGTGERKTFDAASAIAKFGIADSRIICVEKRSGESKDSFTSCADMSDSMTPRNNVGSSPCDSLTTRDSNFIKKSSSCSDLSRAEGYEVLSEPVRHARCNSWTMTDSVELGGMFEAPSNNLPLASFNHISREVISLEKSKYFYVNILGFQVIPRPPFDSPGYWLYGYGLSIHLIMTTRPVEWKQQVFNRISQSSQYLPRVDHIAFITHGMDHIRSILDKAQIYYKYDEPKGTGIRQIFLFDPDGNVIEVSNCQPPVGLIKCIQAASNDYSLGWLNNDIHTKIAGSVGDNVDPSSRCGDSKGFNYINPDLASPIELISSLDAQIKALETESNDNKSKMKHFEAEIARLMELLTAKD